MICDSSGELVQLCGFEAALIFDLLPQNISFGLQEVFRTDLNGDLYEIELEVFDWAEYRAHNSLGRSDVS